ncbi:MAG: hypothetical protein MJZ23_07325 [Paludibacteraceae bacterium]|nr:hypothetical protein [Paludibacteraceae bacterium]
MKKLAIYLLLALGLSACSTPADHFDRVWGLNTKVSANTLKAFNSNDPDAFKQLLADIDKVVAEFNSFDAYNDEDSVYVYAKANAEFTSRFLHEHQAAILRHESGIGARYIDSTTLINERLKAAAMAFMKEYDLNVEFQ